MPPRKKTVVDFKPRSVTISGVTYNAAQLDSYPLQPTSKKSIGGLGGVQYLYLLEDSHSYWQFVDHLAVAACDVADIEGDQSHRVLAIYSDMSKI